MSADLQLLVVFIWATAVHAHSAGQQWSLAAVPLEVPPHQVAALYDEASPRESTIPEEGVIATSAEEPAEESASPKIEFFQPSSSEHTCTLAGLFPAFPEATSSSCSLVNVPSTIDEPTTNTRDERAIELEQLPRDQNSCDSGIEAVRLSSLEPEAGSEPTETIPANIDSPAAAPLPVSQESLSIPEEGDKISMEAKKQKLRELRVEDEDDVTKKEEAVRRRLEQLQQIKENKSPSVERPSRFNRTGLSSPSSSSPPSVAEVVATASSPVSETKRSAFPKVGRTSPAIPGQAPSPSKAQRPSLQSSRPSDAAPPAPRASSTSAAAQPAQANSVDKKKVLISSASQSPAPSLFEKAKLRSPIPTTISKPTQEEADASDGEGDGTHRTDDGLTQEDNIKVADPELVEKARRLVERKTLLKLAKDVTGQVDDDEEEDPERKAWKRRARLRNKEAKLRQDVNLPDGAARRREAEKLKKQRIKEQGSLRPKKSVPAP